MNYLGLIIGGVVAIIGLAIFILTMIFLKENRIEKCPNRLSIFPYWDSSNLFGCSRERHHLYQK